MYSRTTRAGHRLAPLFFDCGGGPTFFCSDDPSACGPCELCEHGRPSCLPYAWYMRQLVHDAPIWAVWSNVRRKTENQNDLRRPASHAKTPSVPRRQAKDHAIRKRPTLLRSGLCPVPSHGHVQRRGRAKGPLKALPRSRPRPLRSQRRRALPSPRSTSRCLLSFLYSTCRACSMFICVRIHSADTQASSSSAWKRSAWTIRGQTDF